MHLVCRTLTKCVGVLALVTGSARIHALEATLVADAHVNSARPAVNSGTISNLYVGAGYTALVQFDLGLLPVGTISSQVTRAVLRLYCNRVDTAGLVNLQGLGASWGEYSVTYATLPSLGSAMQLFQVSQAGSYVAVDVTSVVQGWLASPTTNNGLALTAGTAAVQFDSKENDQTAHPAALDITLASQGPAGPVGPMGPAGSAGLIGSNGDPGATGPAGPAGPVGPAGVSGDLNYRGTYASTMNYDAGDIVVYSGSSFVSMIAGNHGNAPSQSPSQWGLLAAGGTSSTGASSGSATVGMSYQGAYASTSNYALNDVITYLGSSYVSLVVGNRGNLPPSSTAQWGLLAQGGEGVVGPQGPAGLQGPQGEKGAAGLGYVGTYQSTTNYNLSDVVGFQGSSYISLIASNHGNTPSLSSAQWGLLAQAQVGATGATGSTGPAGAVGPGGPQGSAGPVGPTGTSGAPGAQGLPGLTYQGDYSSTTNYKLGDVVFWQGTSYTSLTASNHGNTPDGSPGYWGVLSPRGPTGATGAQGLSGLAGPQGLPGSVGPNGERGPQGDQGIGGQAGTQGIPGQTGSQGLQGPMGPQGLPGPVGMTYRGTYSSTSNYNLADGVTYGGNSYVSLVASNHGNAPDQNPQQWTVFAAAGSQGAPGQGGPAGAPGQTGPQGATGAIGAVGPTGTTGAQGPAVANYVGNFAPTTNYALHDAVAYAGSTYVSMTSENVGNTPDQSPRQWAILVARGAAGTDGAPGPAGPPGPSGVAGLQGPIGPQGPPISFAGGWLVSRAYALGDAASYLGSSYVAIVANVGRQPDVSPTYWNLLAQSGSQGAMGTTGSQGLQGPTGYAGPQGAIGPVGATGAPGIMGPAGTVGPAGPIGQTGAAGPTGAPGLVYQGSYVSNANYGLNDVVSYLGSSYISMVASNQGHSPDQAPSLWSLLAAQGVLGATGAPGATGAQGQQGLQGPQGMAGANGASGATGAAGVAGLRFAGPYVSFTRYASNDAVFYNGSTYISLSSDNQGNAPDQNASWWSMVAQAGAAGAAGQAGAPGASGASGSPGATGATGVAGATGAAGAVGMNFRGDWASAAGYQANDAVLYDGSTYLAQLSNSALRPDLYPNAWAVLAQKGDAGPSGPTGSAATISIGSVTTGAPGAAAAVTNSGSATSAVLNFTIPQGASGGAGTGTGGGAGTDTSGVVFQSMYHAVSYLSTYYSVSTTTGATSEASGAVLTWVPGGCTATKLMVYSQQGNTITVSLRQGLIGSMSNTPLACTVASGSSCTVTGSVTIAAGSFIDLVVSGANSTAAAMWTAVSCQ